MTDVFFKNRIPRDPERYREFAKSLTGASDVTYDPRYGNWFPWHRNPEEICYTLVCRDCPESKPDLILFFKEVATPYEKVVELARKIHGSLFSQANDKYHGVMDGSAPPLYVHSQAFPQVFIAEDFERERQAAHHGKSANYDQACTVSKLFPPDDADPQMRIINVQSLARYFARCWLHPQPANSKELNTHETKIRQEISAIRRASLLPESSISKLEDSLTGVCSQEHPWVLTHRKLSEDTIHYRDSGDIGRISDWRDATVLPFGMELEVLFQVFVYEDLDGWFEYPDREHLDELFWNTFWPAAGIKSSRRRERIRENSEAAAKLGTIIGIGSEYGHEYIGRRVSFLQACFPEEKEV